MGTAKLPPSAVNPAVQNSNISLLESNKENLQPDNATNKPKSAKLSDYKKISKLGEGTFSEVLQVKHRETGDIIALKRFKKHFSSVADIESLREIQALRRLKRHPNIVQLLGVIYEPKNGLLCLALELMEYNLYEVLSSKSNVISEAKAKVYMFQVFKALDYVHSCGIFHRDIKPENILVRQDLIKLADFGSCRSIFSKPPFTEYIATRWYRSPECLLCSGMYGLKMDIWGAGCVLYEVLAKLPLFPGSDELDQLHKIHNVIGSPSQALLFKMLGNKIESSKMAFPYKEGTGLRKLIVSASSDFLVLLEQLLEYDPETRLTANQALQTSWFKNFKIDFVNYSEIEAPTPSKVSSANRSAAPASAKVGAANSSLLNINAAAASKLTGSRTPTQIAEIAQESPSSATSSIVPLAQALLKKKQKIISQIDPGTNNQSGETPKQPGKQPKSDLNYISDMLSKEGTTLLKSTENLKLNSNSHNASWVKPGERKNRGRSIYGDMLNVNSKGGPNVSGILESTASYYNQKDEKALLKARAIGLLKEHANPQKTSKRMSMPLQFELQPSQFSRNSPVKQKLPSFADYSLKTHVLKDGDYYVPKNQLATLTESSSPKPLLKSHMTFHDAHLAKLALASTQSKAQSSKLPLLEMKSSPIKKKESIDPDDLPLYTSLTSQKQPFWGKQKVAYNAEPETHKTKYMLPKTWRYPVDDNAKSKEMFGYHKSTTNFSPTTMSKVSAKPIWPYSTSKTHWS